MQDLEIAFIGGGNMAEAIIAGLLHSGHDANRIHVFDVRIERMAELQQRYDINMSNNAEHAMHASDMTVFAVKPQHMKAVLGGIGHIAEHTTMVSIAAGLANKTLNQWLNCKASWVRVMPNTPCLLGAGMSVLFSDAEAIHHQRAEYLMQSTGDIAWIEHEEQMHAVTAVSGSGPAYFFFLAETMIAEAEGLGLDTALAEKLVIQTAMGAGKMLRESGRSATKLRQQVCSPGGTTQAAIDSMIDNDFPFAVRHAVRAAEKQSKRLG